MTMAEFLAESSKLIDSDQWEELDNLSSEFDASLGEPAGRPTAKNNGRPAYKMKCPTCGLYRKRVWTPGRGRQFWVCDRYYGASHDPVVMEQVSRA